MNIKIKPKKCVNQNLFVDIYVGKKNGGDGPSKCMYLASASNVATIISRQQQSHTSEPPQVAQPPHHNAPIRWLITKIAIDFWFRSCIFDLQLGARDVGAC